MIDVADHECIVCGTPLNEGEIFFGRKKSMNVIFCEDHKDYCDTCEVRPCKGDSCPLIDYGCKN